MPYISSDSRPKFDVEIEKLQQQISSVGELNYVVTRLTLGLLLKQGLSYNNINNCLGTVAMSLLEMYRRTAAAYEDKKIAANGDVQEIMEIEKLIRK